MQSRLGTGAKSFSSRRSRPTSKQPQPNAPTPPILQQATEHSPKDGSIKTQSDNSTGSATKHDVKSDSASGQSWVPEGRKSDAGVSYYFSQVIDRKWPEWAVSLSVRYTLYGGCVGFI